MRMESKIKLVAGATLLLLAAFPAQGDAQEPVPEEPTLITVPTTAEDQANAYKRVTRAFVVAMPSNLPVRAPINTLHYDAYKIWPHAQNTQAELDHLKSLNFYKHRASDNWAVVTSDPVAKFQRLASPDEISQADIFYYYNQFPWMARLDTEANFKADLDYFKAFMPEHLTVRAAIGLVGPFHTPYSAADTSKPLIYAASVLNMDMEKNISVRPPSQWVRGSADLDNPSPADVGVSVSTRTLDGQSAKTYTIDGKGYSFKTKTDILVQIVPNTNFNDVDPVTKVPNISPNRWKNGQADKSGYRLMPPVTADPPRDGFVYQPDDMDDDAIAVPPDYATFNDAAFSDVQNSGKYKMISLPEQFLDLQDLNTWSAMIGPDPQYALEGFELGHALKEDPGFLPWYQSLMQVIVRCQVTTYVDNETPKVSTWYASDNRYVENLIAGLPQTIEEARSRRLENGVVSVPSNPEQFRPFNDADVQRSPYATPDNLVLSPEDRPDGFATFNNVPDPALGEDLFKNFGKVTDKTFSFCYVIGNPFGMHYKMLKTPCSFQSFVDQNGGVVTKGIVEKFLEWDPARWEHIVYIPAWKGQDENGAPVTHGPWVGPGEPEDPMAPYPYSAGDPVYAGGPRWGDMLQPVGFPTEVRAVIDAVLVAGREINFKRGEPTHPFAGTFPYATYIELQDQGDQYAGTNFRWNHLTKMTMDKTTARRRFPPGSIPVLPENPGVEGEVNGVDYYADLSMKLTNSPDADEVERRPDWSSDTEAFKNRNSKVYAIASASCCGSVVVAGSTIANTAEVRPDIVVNVTAEGGESFSMGFSGGPQAGTGESVFCGVEVPFNLTSRTTNFVEYSSGLEENMANFHNQKAVLDVDEEDSLSNPKDKNGNSTLSNEGVMTLVEGERVFIDTCAISGPGHSLVKDESGNEAIAFYIKDLSLKITNKETAEVEKEVQLVENYFQEPCGRVEFLPRSPGEYLVEVSATDRSENSRVIRGKLVISDSSLGIQRMGIQRKKGE